MSTARTRARARARARVGARASRARTRDAGQGFPHLVLVRCGGQGLTSHVASFKYLRMCDAGPGSHIARRGKPSQTRLGQNPRRGTELPHPAILHSESGSHIARGKLQHPGIYDAGPTSHGGPSQARLGRARTCNTGPGSHRGPTSHVASFKHPGMCYTGLGVHMA